MRSCFAAAAAFLAIGCGGTTIASTPDASLDASGCACDGADGGADAEPLDAARDATSDAPSDTSTGSDSGGSVLATCETYYEAHADGCACIEAEDVCVALQDNDASCGGPPGLGLCEQVCGWNDSPTDYAQLCNCITPCLRSCTASNESYWACAVGLCADAGCP
jgi:hypothetical protein